MSRIRPRRMNEREAMLRRHAQAATLEVEARELRKLGNEIARGECADPALAVLGHAVETQDLANDTRFVSRRCSRLRLRGRR